MVSWSALGRSFGNNLIKKYIRTIQLSKNVNFSTGNPLKADQKTFALQPSRWQYHKFKDMLHYYAMVGFIPVSIIIFYSNVFIGPAQLTPIPEGYEPKHWEYYRHPITRFIARYIHNNPQQDYEKFMHFIDEEKQKMKLRALEKQVVKKMAERSDYQAYYYRPIVNKYLRINRKVAEDTLNRMGDNEP